MTKAELSRQCTVSKLALGDSLFLKSTLGLLPRDTIISSHDFILREYFWFVKLFLMTFLIGWGRSDRWKVKRCSRLVPVLRKIGRQRREPLRSRKPKDKKKTTQFLSNKHAFCSISAGCQAMRGAGAFTKRRCHQFKWYGRKNSIWYERFYWRRRSDAPCCTTVQYLGHTVVIFQFSGGKDYSMKKRCHTCIHLLKTHVQQCNLQNNWLCKMWVYTFLEVILWLLKKKAWKCQLWTA